MHCTSCVMLIEGDLEDMNCVVSAHCNYAKGECIVNADADLDNNEIEKLITNDGYSVLNMEEI